jgi:hypothetical protein
VIVNLNKHTALLEGAWNFFFVSDSRDRKYLFQVEPRFVSDWQPTYHDDRSRQAASQGGHVPEIEASSLIPTRTIERQPNSRDGSSQITVPRDNIRLIGVDKEYNASTS